MMWEEPAFTEIKMDAEISSYQDDFDPVRDPLFARKVVEPGPQSAATGAADDAA